MLLIGSRSLKSALGIWALVPSAAVFILAGTTQCVGNARTNAGPAQRLPGPRQLSVQEEVANLKAGIITPYGLNYLGTSKAVEAIPHLEAQFVTARDELDKAQIAQVLVELGDQKSTYWNFLVSQVNTVLNSDSPDPFLHGDDGKLHGVSPAFEQWASTARVPISAALENAMTTYPSYVIFLASTEDPRAVPLLRRALNSQNNLVVAAAAEGLASLKDSDSIPLIIDGASRAPAGSAEVIAKPLAYFDRSDAQDALNRYVNKEEAQRLRERVKTGGRPLRPES